MEFATCAVLHLSRGSTGAVPGTVCVLAGTPLRTVRKDVLSSKLVDVCCDALAAR